MTQFTPLATPFDSSYASFSNSGLQALASAQAVYHPQAPAANQSEALSLINSAQQATDPALKKELLQRALALLTPQDGSQGAQPPATDPSQGAGAASPSQGASNPDPSWVDPSANAGGNASPTSDPTATSGTPASSTAPTADSTGSSQGLTSDPSGNSVSTGRYTITGSTSNDGSLTIHDNQTGKDVQVWGDPHVKVDGKDVADFQKNGLNIQLQDGTQVHIQPTAEDGSGKSHIGQVAVTKGDQAVTMSGFTGGGMHTSDVMNGQASNVSSMYDAPGTTHVTEGDDDNLYHNNADGSMGSEITPTNGQETDLDGSGGGSINGSMGNSTPAAYADASSGGADYSQLIQQLEQAVGSNSSGMMQTLMESALQQMQSTSGYAQA